MWLQYKCARFLANELKTDQIDSEAGTEIHLHCAVNEPKQLITFTVTDTGKGIPPEMAEEIFERFKKLDKFVQGTGLGLSICRIIAELLEGKIYLDTTYTGGARFVFEMKLHKTLPPSNTSSDK